MHNWKKQQKKLKTQLVKVILVKCFMVCWMEVKKLQLNFCQQVFIKASKNFSMRFPTFHLVRLKNVFNANFICLISTPLYISFLINLWIVSSTNWAFFVGASQESYVTCWILLYKRTTYSCLRIHELMWSLQKTKR